MIKNILTNFSARFGGAIINFLVLLITSNTLGADIRGEISLIQLALNIIHLISDIAGGPAMVYLIPRSNLRPLLLIGYGWATLVALVFGWLVVWLGDIDPENQISVIVLAWMLSMYSVNQNVLIGREQIRWYNILLILQAVLMIITISICIYSGYQHSAKAFITGGFVGTGTVLILSTWLVSKFHVAPTLEKVKRPFFLLFRNGFFTQLASLTHQLSIRINFYLLGSAMVIPILFQMHLTNKAAIGIYSNSISLAEAILLFSASIATVLGARVANQEDSLQTRKLTLQLSKLSLVMTIPALLLFLLLPAGFYSGLLGKDFGPVKSVFLFITPGAVCVSFSTVFSHYFSGRGKHYLNAISGALALITTLITAWIFIPRYGLIGAGLSASCAYTVMATFIFTAFLLEKGRIAGEWRYLIPSRGDVQMLKQEIQKLTQKKR